MRYKAHPDFKTLICFVYDPDGKIANPKGLIDDIEKEATDDFAIKVIINPDH